MEPIFTLPFMEYICINEITKYFKKNDGYSILIPTSRQQKGFDFVLFNQKNNMSTKFQVKSSKIYYHNEPKKKTKKQQFKYYVWLNKFEIEEHDSDYYLFCGIYNKDPQRMKLDHSKDYTKWYQYIFFLLTKEELDSLFKTFNEKTFSIGFNDSNKAFLVKGKGKDTFEEISHYILNQKKLEEVDKKIQKMVEIEKDYRISSSKKKDSGEGIRK